MWRSQCNYERLLIQVLQGWKWRPHPANGSRIRYLWKVSRKGWQFPQAHCSLEKQSLAVKEIKAHLCTVTRMFSNKLASGSPGTVRRSFAGELINVISNIIKFHTQRQLFPGLIKVGVQKVGGFAGSWRRLVCHIWTKAWACVSHLQGQHLIVSRCSEFSALLAKFNI